MSVCPHCNEIHSDDVDFCPKVGRPIVDLSKRMIGRTIAGKYKLLKTIGQGGMGTIFEAEHTIIGNRVAVKLLHETFSEQREPVQRLYREAQATGAIGHPSIIKIFDVDETNDGVPFLVMELLEGESLGDYLERKGPSKLGFVLDVSIQILSALHAAHRAGIIHRDLKSDNIFLVKTEDGTVDVKILDFGISKFVKPDADNLRLTQTGSVLGTPYYMSPEQASGKKDLDHRIDIYAAGVIIYEALVGNIPHAASNYNALLIEIITEDIKSFRWRRADIPEVLEKAVLKALSRERENRWLNALDFMEELSKIRDNIPSGVLNGEPALGSTFARVDRNTNTLDVNDEALDSSRELPVAFETMGGASTGFFPASAGAKMVFGIVLSVMVIGLLAIAIFAFWGTSNTDEAAYEMRSSVRVDNISSIGSAPIGQADGGEDKESEFIMLKVARTPDDALVTLDGEVVPIDGLKIPKGITSVEISASAGGCEPRTMTIVPSRDVELNIVLQKKKRAIAKGKRRLKRHGKHKTKSSITNAPSSKKLIFGLTNKEKSEEVTPIIKVYKDSQPAKDKKKSGKKRTMDSPMDNPF